MCQLPDSISLQVEVVLVNSDANGWQSVLAQPLTITLPIAQRIELGAVKLGPTTVNEVRLRLAEDGHTIFTSDGQALALVVPSGAESGLKLHGPWSMGECKTLDLALVLDVAQSVTLDTHETGSGQWMLRPVVATKPSCSSAPTRTRSSAA